MMIIFMFFHSGYFGFRMHAPSLATVAERSAVLDSSLVIERVAELVTGPLRDACDGSPTLSASETAIWPAEIRSFFESDDDDDEETTVWPVLNEMGLTRGAVHRMCAALVTTCKWLPISDPTMVRSAFEDMCRSISRYSTTPFGLTAALPRGVERVPNILRQASARCLLGGSIAVLTRGSMTSGILPIGHADLLARDPVAEYCRNPSKVRSSLDCNCLAALLDAAQAERGDDDDDDDDDDDLSGVSESEADEHADDDDDGLLSLLLGEGEDDDGAAVRACARGKLLPRRRVRRGPRPRSFRVPSLNKMGGVALADGSVAGFWTEITVTSPLKQTTLSDLHRLPFGSDSTATKIIALQQLCSWAPTTAAGAWRAARGFEVPIVALRSLAIVRRDTRDSTTPSGLDGAEIDCALVMAAFTIARRAAECAPPPRTLTSPDTTSARSLCVAQELALAGGSVASAARLVGLGAGATASGDDNAIDIRLESWYDAIVLDLAIRFAESEATAAPHGGAAPTAVDDEDSTAGDGGHEGRLRGIVNMVGRDKKGRLQNFAFVNCDATQESLFLHISDARGTFKEKQLMMQELEVNTYILFYFIQYYYDFYSTFYRINIFPMCCVFSD